MSYPHAHQMLQVLVIGASGRSNRAASPSLVLMLNVFPPYACPGLIDALQVDLLLRRIIPRGHMKELPRPPASQDPA